MKTTAKVEHRDYVPYGWIAIEFCRVNFFGARAEKMEEKWDAIKRERYIKYTSLYEENEKTIQDFRDQANIIRRNIKNSKPFYRFWHTKTEKDMLSKAKSLSTQADKLEKENEKISSKRFFGVYECHRKIENLLIQNGFVLTSTSSSGDSCTIETEIWTLEE